MTVAYRAGVAAATILAWGALRFGAVDPIPFPRDYRLWAHVKTAIVGPQSEAFPTEGGIHHVYANDEAVEGYLSGEFPDGSILVYDLLETSTVQGNTVEGKQRRVDVMVKRSAKYPDTGGWGFASFPPGSREPGEARSDCFGCHQREGRDHVFSEFRSIEGLSDPTTKRAPGSPPR